MNCETAVFFLTDYSVGVVKSMKVLCLWSVKHYLVGDIMTGIPCFRLTINRNLVGASWKST